MIQWTIHGEIRGRKYHGEGEVPRFGLDGGVPLEPQNPYPSLRVILAEKATIVKDFSWKIGPFFVHFAILGVFTTQKPKNFGLSKKIRPMFKDF